MQDTRVDSSTPTHRPSPTSRITPGWSVEPSVIQFHIYPLADAQNSIFCNMLMKWPISTQILRSADIIWQSTLNVSRTLSPSTSVVPNRNTEYPDVLSNLKFKIELPITYLTTISKNPPSKLTQRVTLSASTVYLLEFPRYWLKIIIPKLTLKVPS